MKTCNCLVQDDGTTVRQPEKILQLQRKFYEKLYRKNSKIAFVIPNLTHPQIT